MLTSRVWADPAACAGCAAVTAQGGGAASYLPTGQCIQGQDLCSSAVPAQPNLQLELDLAPCPRHLHWHSLAHPSCNMGWS